jgi:hypothetical protein
MMAFKLHPARIPGGKSRQTAPAPVGGGGGQKPGGETIQ